MNKVELCGGLYYFRFEHEPPFTSTSSGRLIQGITACTIYKAGSPEGAVGLRIDTKLCEGIARCHEKDIFVKEIGRKVSLAKAISNIPFPTTPQERARFWAAYFWRVPGNKIEVVCER